MRRLYFMRRVFIAILVLCALGGLIMVITIGLPRLVSVTFPPAHRDLVNAVNIEKCVQLYMADQGLSEVPPGFSLAKLATGDTPYLAAKDLLDRFGRSFAIEVPGRNGGQLQ